MNNLRMYILMVAFAISVSLNLQVSAWASEDIFSMSLDELMDVEVVTASRQSEELRESVATTYVITGDELKAMGARTIYDALKHVPGLTYGMNTGGANRVWMRGVGSDYSSQIVFMLDGHVINDPVTGGIGSFSDAVAVDNIDRIEVVLGPVSSLYGANAFLGVINIITMDGWTIDGAQGRFRAEFDKAGHVYNYYDVLMGKSFENGWQGALNLSCRNGDGPELRVNKDRFGREGYADPSLELYNADFRVENDQASLKGHYMHRNGGAYFGIANVLNDGSHVGETYLFIDGLYRFKPLNDLEVEIRGGYDYFKMDNRYDMFPKGSIPPSYRMLYAWNDTGYIKYIKVKTNEYSLNMSSTWTGFVHHALTFGLSYRYQELRDPETYSNNDFIYTGGVMLPVPAPDVRNISDVANWLTPASRNNYAVYVQDIWDMMDGLRFTASGRYDYYTDFGSSFSPRVGLSYELTEGYQLRFLYGRAFRAPDFGSQYLQNNLLVSGNPSLDPEYINTFEAGVRASVTENLYVETVYYYNDIHNLIGLDNGSPRVYRNINDVSVNGVDFMARYDFGNGLNFKAAYSWKDLNADRDYTGMSIPAHSGSFEINYQIMDFINWNINAYAQSSLPRNSGDTRDNMDAYFLLDSTFILRACRHADLEFSIFNITDEDYAYPSQPDTIPGDFTAPGRSFVMGLTLKY